MNKKDLQAAGCLVPDTLTEAAGRYKERELSGTKAEITETLVDMVMRNGEENTYFDFYYGTLSEEEKRRILACLTKEEAEFLEQLQPTADREEVYFAYEEPLFHIALKLSVDSCLFSTFYFAKTKETVWSNYDCRFLIFYEKKRNGF